MTTTKKPRRRWLVPTVVGVAAGIAGISIGAAGTPEPEIVVETVTETETITEEIEVEVEVTPQACTLALDHAEELFDIYSNILFASADGFESAADFDIQGIEAASGRVQALQPDLEDELNFYFIAARTCDGGWD